MTEAKSPTVLNLDELETTESEIKIVHEGKEHTMRTLTVELFIKQQKRAAEQEKLATQGIGEDDSDIADLVCLIRDAVAEFFPTLPVNDLETPKLFSIFAWLNEMSAKVSETNSEEFGEEDEGNVEKVEG